MLVEFDAIDGLTPTGEVDGNGRLDLAEVQTAIQLGTNDIYMKTALSYLEDTLGKYVDPQGMSINDFKLLAAMEPAKDPTGTLVAPETGINYFDFNGAQDSIALLGNAPQLRNNSVDLTETATEACLAPSWSRQLIAMTTKLETQRCWLIRAIWPGMRTALRANLLLTMS